MEKSSVKNVFFPAEAFCLALVLIGTGLVSALFAAAVLFVFSILFATTMNKNSAAVSVGKAVLGVILMVLLTAGLILINGYSYAENFAAIATAVLAVIGLVESAKETDEGSGMPAAGQTKTVSSAAKQAFFAAVLLIVFSAVREILSAGTILGIELIDSEVVASYYGRTAMGLIFAGFMIAAVAAGCGADFSRRGTIFVVIPVALSLMIDARGIGGIAKEVFILIIILAALFSIRKRLAFSETGRPFQGMPIELIMAGILYMVLSWL